jgi:hypothetical protein
VKGLKRRAGTTIRGRGAALVAVFIAFVPLAFSEDFLDAVFETLDEQQPRWALFWVDAALLALILLLTLWLQPRLVGAYSLSLLTWWALGAGLTLGLDTAAAGALPWALPDTIGGDLGASLLYVISLAILLAATVGADPRRMLTSSGRDRDRDAWSRFRPALPLLAGTLAAYVGSVIWLRELDPGAIRTFEDARCAAKEMGLIGEQAGLTPGEEVAAINGLCAGAVSQEYFAQLSQVIPLLLVALGLEARFFERLLEESVQRAMTIFTVVILCVGEALAISALPEPNQNCGDVLYGWHEYTAFILTLEACFVALATLAWALVVAAPRRRRGGLRVTPRSARPQGRGWHKRGGPRLPQ